MLLVFAACGGDDGASLEDYFGELQAAGQAYEAAGDELDAAIEDSTDPLGDVKSLLPEFEDDLDGFVATLEGIEAPEEAAAAHDEAVSAGRAASAAFDELLAGLEGVNDLGALLAFFEGPEFAAFGQAGEQFTESCFSLQAIADGNDVDVDLGCG